MEVEIVKMGLETPEKFDFPFNPYPIQKDFMKNLYGLIEGRKLGIFESPTGTGKSLSIICGALKWLIDHEGRQREELTKTIDFLNGEKSSITGSDWLSSQSKEIEINQKINKIRLEQEKIERFDEKILKIRAKSKRSEIKSINKNKTPKPPEKTENEPIEAKIEDKDEFLLDEAPNESSDEEEEVEEDKFTGTKIFICSRTHSQLAQLVHEVEKTVFSDKIRMITLASRQNYCINPDVNRLNNVSLINERCLDLQKKTSKSTLKDLDGNSVKKKREKTSCKCPYMNQTQIDELKNAALSKIQDVEDLVKTAKNLNACPYYAARGALEDSQIIVLPYNLILHKSTREASGIKLKDNIVIIDEAHNLLEAMAEMYSAQISGHQLVYAHSQLTEYRNKYQTRFNAKNLLSINQILFIVKKLIRILGGNLGCTVKDLNKEVSTKLYTFEDFITETDIDNLNIYDLLKFCSNTKLCHKLLGFSQKFQPSVTIQKKIEPKGVSAFLKEISINKETVTEEKDPVEQENIPRNPMLAVIAFLECFTNRCEDGRIVCSKQTILGKSFLKFVLLNPSSHFRSIVSEARAVLVAGGTMQPMSEFRNRLFISSGAAESRILEYSCDHIVPPDNILPIIISNGPMGAQLDFSYNFRNLPDTLDELGSVLQNVCSIVPSGIVCFFPSYDYEKFVYNHLEKRGILKQISNKKVVFREPKSSSDVDKTLSLYAKAIKHCSGGKTGAILFSVVGGKLSEGLNFSDDLGRCVVVVGMPYPNIKSPELQEKMSYLDKTEGAGSGNLYYENLCMKAVNQCIGRAVRHRNDYACVLLLDKRYSRPKTKDALPKWIQRSLVSYEKFGQAFANITKFFNMKKASSASC